MRRIVVSLFLILCLSVSAFAFADQDAVFEYDVYAWTDDTHLELYELCSTFTLPDGWSRASEEMLSSMNDVDPSVVSASALNPYVMVYLINADETVATLLCSEEVVDPETVADAHDYLLLFANDILASADETGLTYTYDPESVTDFSLVEIPYCELTVTVSDGTIIDLLCTQGGLGTFYTFVIEGSLSAVEAFTPEFINAFSEIEAVG